jgi:hypothetical protein
MATTCVSLARGKMLRITKLDSCGAVVSGAGGTLTAKAFISGTITPNYADTEEITQQDANGDLCIDDRSPVALRWLDIELNVCTVDPTMINLVTGDPIVVDDASPTPNNVGFRIDGAVSGSANFGLEIWEGVTGQACTAGGFTNYGYFLFPWVKDAQWGEWTHENGALTFTWTARAVFNSQWGTGPYLVRRDATTPATIEKLVTAIGPTTAMHFEVTSAPLPTPACGATVLTPAP